MKNLILDGERIHRILKRIAYQVIEECHDEKAIILVGIAPRGTWVVDKVAEHLRSLGFTAFQVRTINEGELGNARPDPAVYSNSCVILCDDIINSGKSMMIAASQITLAGARRIITACLVDRKHRLYPIQSELTGLSLSTTIGEHLSLVTGDEPAIFLE